MALELKGNYYWRYTHFSLNHDYMKKGSEFLDEFVCFAADCVDYHGSKDQTSLPPKNKSNTINHTYLGRTLVKEIYPPNTSSKIQPLLLSVS